MSAKWLSKDEVKKLRKYCKEKEALDKGHGRFIGIRNRALIEFLLGTGFRASECRDTKIQDLGLNVKNGSDPFVKVRTLKRKKQVVDVVTIDKELAKLLSDYIKELSRFKGKSATTAKSYLFPGRYGKKMQLITIEKALKKILQSAGLPVYYSVHSLRHTHGFHLYQANMNLKLVQERLRHANIQTASIYVGVREGEEQETINGLYD
jgi:integrase